MEQQGIEATATRGGGKAQALKNVLDQMPQEVFTEIVVRAVSEMGWEKSPWSDDAFPTIASILKPQHPWVVQAQLLGERA